MNHNNNNPAALWDWWLTKKAKGANSDRKWLKELTPTEKQTLILMMNTANTNTANGVNGRVGPANFVTPGRFSVENQTEAGGHHATGDEQNVHQKENQKKKEVDEE